MTQSTLDQDKQRFAEWRSQRQGRHRIPEALWHLACQHISTLGITRVAREFRLNDNKLRVKALQAGIVMANRSKRQIAQPANVTFQEVTLERLYQQASRLLFEVGAYARSQSFAAHSGGSPGSGFSQRHRRVNRTVPPTIG
jgi:hypothetical protein